jgi:hypothetical protein
MSTAPLALAFRSDPLVMSQFGPSRGLEYRRRKEIGMMNRRQGFSATATAMLAAAVLMLATPPAGRAAGPNDDDNESKIQRGFAIAPVTLDLTGKNVGWDSAATS